MYGAFKWPQHTGTGAFVRCRHAPSPAHHAIKVNVLYCTAILISDSRSHKAKEIGLIWIAT